MNEITQATPFTTEMRSKLTKKEIACKFEKIKPSRLLNKAVDNIIANAGDSEMIKTCQAFLVFLYREILTKASLNNGVDASTEVAETTEIAMYRMKTRGIDSQKRGFVLHSGRLSNPRER